MMKKKLLRGLLLTLLIVAIIILVPSSALLLDAIAEEAQNILPAAEPIFPPLTAPAPLPIDNTPGFKPNPNGYLPDQAGYADGSIRVTIEKQRAYETDIMLARVQMADPSQLRTAMAYKYGSSHLAVGATMAKKANAVLALNGDYFSFHSKGYLVRNGHLYRNKPSSKYDTLLIDDKGDFHIIRETSAQKLEAFDKTVIHSFTFGPALVVDGEMIDLETIQKRDAGTYKKTQRAVICQVGPLDYLCVVTEGPESKGSEGLTIKELALYCQTLGVQVAYNLDGGSSTTLVLNNKKINSLSSGKTRELCDILYFATAIPNQ